LARQGLLVTFDEQTDPQLVCTALEDLLRKGALRWVGLGGNNVQSGGQRILPRHFSAARDRMTNTWRAGIVLTEEEGRAVALTCGEDSRQCRIRACRSGRSSFRSRSYRVSSGNPEVVADRAAASGR
jgi:hypothetical protein